MKLWGQATAWSRAAMAACVAVFIVPAALSFGLGLGLQGPAHGTDGQRGQSPAQAPRSTGHPSGAGPRAGQGRSGERRVPYPGPPYLGPNSPRPTYKGYPRPIDPPAGHLQSWLNAHGNLPLQRQEQLLRGDPSFQHLVPGEQQRLIQQLQDVDRLTAQQRQRRLARAENLERLSAEDRMSVNRSAREWTALPPQRQAAMKNAFHALRAVPPDQRGTVLNSQRYREQFTPQERGILTELLRVEPFEPAQP